MLVISMEMVVGMPRDTINRATGVSIIFLYCNSERVKKTPSFACFFSL